MRAHCPPLQLNFIQSNLNSIILFTARAIAERILSSRFFEESRSISCYLSMPTAEADTSQLVPEILSSGMWMHHMLTLV